MRLSEILPVRSRSACDIETELHPRDSARLRQLCSDVGVRAENVRLAVGHHELCVMSGALALPTCFLLKHPPQLILPADADLCPDTEVDRAMADAAICHELAHVKWHDETVIHGLGWVGIACSFGIALALPWSRLLRGTRLGFWPLQAACVGLGVANLYGMEAACLAYARFAENRADREAARKHQAGTIAFLMSQLNFQITAGRQSPFIAAQLDAEGNNIKDRWHPPLTERIRKLNSDGARQTEDC
jgi:Peptidase family M48